MCYTQSKRQVRVQGGGVTFNPSLTEAAPLLLALAGDARSAKGLAPRYETHDRNFGRHNKLARGTVALSAAVRGRRFDHGGFHRPGDRTDAHLRMSENGQTAEVPRASTKRRD